MTPIHLGENNLTAWTDSGYSLEEARILIEWLRGERRRLRRHKNLAGKTAAEKRNVDRFARHVTQRRVATLREYRPRNFPKLLLAARFAPHPLLDGLFPDRPKRWTSVLRRPYGDTYPEINLKNFSFVHNPAGTMRALAEIVECECTHARARLNFLDPECLDIGSYLVLQAIRQFMAPVFDGGRLEIPIQKVIDAVGLRSALNMAPFRAIKDHEDVWPFPLQVRRGGKSQSANRFIAPQKKEQAADNFVQTINDWLHLVAKQKLSLEGKRLVLKTIGEALDNAERHSVAGSDDGDWAVTGFLSRATIEDRNRYRCHLAFLSLGETIAQTILSSPQTTLDKMDAYVRRHKRVDPELLRTVFALQDGVTKDRDAAAEGRGGTGIQDILEFFADLGGSRSISHYARLTIISGNTCVQAFTPYIKGTRKGGLDTERELWFNHPNDPTYPPEQAHVFRLPDRLNGTLVTMVMDLDLAYLEETVDASDRT